MNYDIPYTKSYLVWEVKFPGDDKWYQWADGRSQLDISKPWMKGAEARLRKITYHWAMAEWWDLDKEFFRKEVNHYPYPPMLYNYWINLAQAIPIFNSFNQ